MIKIMEENKDIWNGGEGHDIKMNYFIKFDPLSAGKRITRWKATPLLPDKQSKKTLLIINIINSEPKPLYAD